MLMNNSRPDFLTEFRELASSVLRLNPKATIPPETADGLTAVRKMLYALQNPPEKAATPVQRQWIDVTKLQSETATKLADFVQRGIVKYEDYEFPSDDLPPDERARGLNGMNARLQRAWEEHNWTAETRVKMLQLRVEALETEIRNRLAAIEQELSRT